MKSKGMLSVVIALGLAFAPDNDGLDDGWEIDNDLDPLDGVCPWFICHSGSWRHLILSIE